MQTKRRVERIETLVNQVSGLPDSAGVQVLTVPYGQENNETLLDAQKEPILKRLREEYGDFNPESMQWAVVTDYSAR